MHDFTALPCQLHADCLNCNELVCVKGEVHKEAALRQKATETEMLLAVAASAREDGDFGADRWVTEHSKTLTRIQEFLSIVDDPSVETGALIRANNLFTPPLLQQITPALSSKDTDSGVGPRTSTPILPFNPAKK